MAELYLIEFKGSRKEYFFNNFYHNLKVQDYVVTQAERGEDIGIISKKIESDIDVNQSEKPRSILRKANPEDLTQHKELKGKDKDCKFRIVDLIRKHGLFMKVVDVETQLDGNKMTIFFTADQRVDFRELVKELASSYKTRIELRQIGVRDEARRIGGYGVCGKLQCCCSFIKTFSPISTQQARDQDLSMNPSKISGNCGRLLCCLRFEADMYKKCKSKFPPVGTFIKTNLGEGVISKIDIFTEEAVVRGADNIPFRAKLIEIQSVEKNKKITPGYPYEPIQDDVESADEKDQLNKLDDEEN